MRKVLILLCVLFVTSIYGQENKTVTARLKERYSYVAYGSRYYTVSSDYKHYGLYDSQGKEILPCKYSLIHESQLSKLGVCWVEMAKKEGVVDKYGRTILPAIYDIVNIENNYIQAKKDENWGLFDINGDVIIPLRYNGIVFNDLENQDYCFVQQNKKYGLYHIRKKKELLPCIFNLLSFDDKIGLLEAEQDGKHGLYTVEGKDVLSCKYDYLSLDEKSGFLKAEQNGKNGLYTLDGKEIIPCKYDYIWDYVYKETGCFEVELNDKRGVYNDKGKELLPCRYDNVFINGGYISFSLNEKNGLYSIKDSKEILKPEYYYLGTPSEDLVLYQKVKNGKYGYMDLTGKVVIEPQYDDASSFKDGIAQVTKNGVTSIIKHPLNGTNLDVVAGSEVWVDTDIPQTSIQNEEAFAFIIANENYTHFSGADYSHNDGKVFAEYCKRTLGFPESNVRYYEDSTYGNIANALKQLKDIVDVYEGDAKIIFYFSGLGIVDDKTKERYILPTDASMASLTSTGYNVTELMSTLNLLKTQYTLFIVDAPFNGNGKDGKPLITGRGIMIVNRQIAPQTNVIGLLCSEDGKCYSSKKLQHSVLTYSLLEKLKTEKGNCSIMELIDTSCQSTKKESLKQFKEAQTPQKIVSESVTNVLTNSKL